MHPLTQLVSGFLYPSLPGTRCASPLRTGLSVSCRGGAKVPRDCLPWALAAWIVGTWGKAWLVEAFQEMAAFRLSLGEMIR